PATPAVGWAAGIERLAMLVEGFSETERPVAILPESSELEARAIEVAAILRRNGISCWSGFRGNPKKRGAKARADGTEASLYVREVDSEGREFNFTSISDQSDYQDIFARIQQALGAEKFRP
ncbi:MAG TPA: histidine--tRNA ligase, partial [Sphingopyxis sp.]|nr:histidine--tRNA ligase [Sphingopyxis sp.]